MGTIARSAGGGNPLPFAAIPHEINADPRVNRTDYAVVGKLLEYAWQDDHTTVSDGRMAKDMGVDVATVQRSLKRLDKAGWIRRRNRPTGPHNRTGREIVLCWRLPDFEVPRIALADGTSDVRISGRVCAKMRSPLRKNAVPTTQKCVTTKIVVVEGEENKTPLTPHSFHDNDDDPGPAVIPMAPEDHEARGLVEDLGGSMAEAIEAVEPGDEDAEAARPVPHVYPMAGCEALAHVPPDWAEAILLTSDEVEAEAVLAPPVAAEAPGSKRQDDGLTPGQVEWLASLPPPQRSAFDGLSPGRKAMVLDRRPHGACTDPMLLRMEAADLAPRVRFAAERAMPTTLEAMWEALPGGPSTWPQLAAEMTCRHLGGDEDRKLWPAFHVLALAVWRGQFSPDGVLDALRQANKPGVRNRGALFNTALQRNHWRW